jgi:succinate dehydrogenase / fumarate reductase, iron-sulfur subunit
MSEYTLRIRRYSPETGEAASWQDYTIELEGHRSVLDGILQARDRQDGSIGIRCSCRAAICGSCGVRINGKPALACHTHLEEAAKTAAGVGWNPPDEGQTTPVITVEPMGNMPVIKDLIVDMDAVHWAKIQRVTPWLIPDGPAPEREYIVPAEAMIDVTQTMACIQCGACVSDCLSMEVDPLFIGPAALAKAYRFVGDPRDGQQKERLQDLSEDPHGIYDCTHCFNCIEACPKGVAPMSQIMRLRRIAGADHKIVDRNNGHRHEDAFVGLIRQRGILQEAELLPRSYGGNSWFGKFHPAAAGELVNSLPAIVTALRRGKVTPAGALGGHKLAKQDLSAIENIYRKIDDADERFELNLYVVGEEDETTQTETAERTASE